MDNNYELLNQKIESVEKLLTDKINNLETNKINPLENDCRSVKSDIVTLKQQNTKTDVQYTNIMSVLSELKTQVEEIKNKPAKRYESIVGSILGAIFGAIGGAIVGLFIK